MSLKPEVKEIITRHSAIDWRNPPHDQDKVISAFHDRLKATGLNRTVRWVTDPENTWDGDACWVPGYDWDAWIARDVLYAMDSLDTRGSKNALDARTSWLAKCGFRPIRKDHLIAIATDAWVYGVAEAAGAAWVGKVIWEARDAIGFMNIPNPDKYARRLIEVYGPMCQALEGGAFLYIFGVEEVSILATPSIHLSNGRLHREDGPAIEWPKTKIYFWDGVEVPPHWINDKDDLDPAEVLKTKNVEQRSTGARIIGWPKMLSVLKPKVIDGDPETELGALIEFALPGLPNPGRFLQAQCPRNGTIVEGIPWISDIDGKPINTVIGAQAWRLGDTESEFVQSEKRT